MRLKTKMLLIILLTTSIIYIIAVGLISFRFRDMALENAIKLADSYVREHANAVETSLNEDIAVARTMAGIFKGYYDLGYYFPNIIYDESQRQVLVNNKRFIAVFVQWELNAIDDNYLKPYGRVRKTYHWRNPEMPSQKPQVVWISDTLDTEGDDTTGIYYRVKANKKEYIINPYFYSYSIEYALPSDIPVTQDAILETTIIVPILKDGDFIGMAGMDIPLNAFQEIIDQIKPFDESYSFLIANDGSFVAHPILENISGSITEIDSVFTKKYKLLKKIRGGHSFSFIDVDKEGRQYYYSLAPVVIGLTGMHWSMGIAVPMDVVMASAMKNFYIAIAIGIVGLLFMAIVVWLVSRNITRPIEQTTAILKYLAKGIVDDSMIQKIESKDELGEMTQSSNTLVNFLRTTSDFARQIGKDNLEADYTLLSDKDVLGLSLIDMRDNLRHSKEKIQAQAEKLILSNKELEKLSIVARETDNAVLIMDAMGNLEWVNEGLEALYGFSFEEYKERIGNNLTRVSANPKIQEYIDQCIRDKKAVQYISENETSTGDIFWAQTTLTPILDEDKEVTKLVAIDSDITKIIEAENEVKKYVTEIEKHRDELQELNATKDRFFAIIAHDLKNPFSALLSVTQSLNDSFGELENDEKIFAVDHIFRTTTRIFNLLDNLLLWATSQTGRIKFNREKINLHRLVEENVDLAKSAADKKEIQITNEVPKNVIAYADRNMISTVLRNLISNAMKYSNQNGTIQLKGSEGLVYGNNELIEISVIDDGIGIGKEYLPKLFRIDENPSTPGTAEEKGTGLGLILCKDFVEKNGGSIKVESELNKGSTFSFTVPAFNQ